jgi:hypothetical protein
MPWSARFDVPIPVPGGGEIVTLREAGDFIMKLSRRAPAYGRPRPSAAAPKKAAKKYKVIR